MKVILTEAQLNLCLNEARMARLLQESLNNSQNMEDLKRKIRKYLAAGIAATSLILAISKLGLPDKEKQQLCNMINGIENTTDSTFTKRVDACRDYMAYILKNQGRTIEDTDMDPEVFIKVADETGLPESFIMAAADLESKFCTSPRAKRTNSAFSVGSYDNGKNAVIYNNPNESIKGFADLIINHYLIGGRTLEDLLRPGAYVNDDGKRYATDPNYETKMLSIINRIKKMYPDLT